MRTTLPHWAFIALLPIALGGIAPFADAATPRKSAKECNEELQKNEAALKEAGETAAAFIHACWWSSTPGTPTPIEARKNVPEATPAKEAKTSAAKTSEGKTSEGKTSDYETAASRSGPRAARAIPHGSRRVVVSRRGPRGAPADADSRADAPTEADASTDRPLVRPTRVETALPIQSTSQVDLSLPGGVRVVVPVLPGFEPAVRDILDSRALPGVVEVRP